MIKNRIIPTPQAVPHHQKSAGRSLNYKNSGSEFQKSDKHTNMIVLITNTEQKTGEIIHLIISPVFCFYAE
jgi:hypothetical protein